jgi:3'-phosphoadenosine 5'-phosphosulfate (PAPS) 3'-phosphatase
VLGVVYQPLSGLLFRAVNGGGTWIERDGQIPDQARVSTRNVLSEMRLAASRSHRSP